MNGGRARICLFHFCLLGIYQSSLPIISFAPSFFHSPTGKPHPERGEKALTKKSHICNHQTEHWKRIKDSGLTEGGP